MQRGLTWVTILLMVLAGGKCEPLLQVSNAPHNTLTLDGRHTVHFVHPKGESPSYIPVLSNDI